MVLPYEFSNMQELEQFIHSENLEVLINEQCIDNCPSRREYWTSVNDVYLEGNISQNTLIIRTACRFTQLYSNGQRRLHHITRDMLSAYEKMGINHFKNSGRIESYMAFVAYHNYFIRSEYGYLYDIFINKFTLQFNEWINR